MDTFLDLITIVQADVNANSNSTMYNPPTVKAVINRAYIVAAAMFLWPETEDAKKTSTILGSDYYDYPQLWRGGSMWKLKIDGVDYGDPLAFKDYLFEKENSFPSQLKQLWANQWRRFHVYPVPATNGNNNIEMWGQKAVDLLSADGDTTIFSYSMRECNQAITLEATKLLKMQGDAIQSTIVPRVGELHDLEAQQILHTAWGKIQQQKTKNEKTIPMFDVPDFFGKGRVKDTIGNF